jgi:DNA-binding response OmpR family regulator
MHRPRIEGAEVLRRIKADPATSHISIVVLSGVAEAETIRRSLKDGADGYLTKPFDVRELLDLIDRLLATHVQPDHIQIGGDPADADSDEVLSSRTARPGGRGRSSQ